MSSFRWISQQPNVFIILKVTSWRIWKKSVISDIMWHLIWYWRYDLFWCIIRKRFSRDLRWVVVCLSISKNVGVINAKWKKQKKIICPATSFCFTFQRSHIPYATVHSFDYYLVAPNSCSYGKFPQSFSYKICHKNFWKITNHVIGDVTMRYGTFQTYHSKDLIELFQMSGRSFLCLKQSRSY